MGWIKNPIAIIVLAAIAGTGFTSTPASAQWDRYYDDNYNWVKRSYRPYRGQPSRDYSGRQTSRSVRNGGPRPYIAAVAPSVVKFRKRYAKGSIVIDTKARKLYYVLGKGRAYRYPIAVGKRGFAWTGTSSISAKKNWPDWRPPKEMRKRKPSLPKLMRGGLNNPLGAKALYLGKSLYRIHGTNNAKSIGTASSSGCFRMHNAHVAHLSKITKIGTKVYVKRQL